MKRRGMETASGWLHSLLLAVFFFLGVLSGIGCAARVPEGVSGELSRYLSAYLDAVRQQAAPVPGIRQLAAAYFWGPAAAFFCGFSAVGVLLLPLLAMACGFFPAYTVSCLTAAFGSRGVWLAAALFGLRYLVVIPCFFLLAAPSLRTASARLRFQSRPADAESRRGWLHFACVCLVLLLGGWVDFRLSPWFLRLLLEPIFS